MSISLSQHIDESMKLPQKLFFGEFHTDEIFAVSMGRPEKLGKKYFLGIIIAPYIGWSLGTFLGAVCGEILPAMVVSALGVALYGMFIAIIVPAAKRERPVLMVVLIAVIISCIIRFVPMFGFITGGFSIIICAVIASAAGAALFPVRKEEEHAS